MEKLLTITIPIYNTEAYLPRCLDSLLVPEYMDRLEILAIIDGSPDNSLEIARRYEQMYPDTVKVIDKENGGHGSVINKGIELATGKYFRVLDSDDWFDTDEFKKYLAALSQLDVDMVLSNYSREEIYHNKSIEIKYNGVEYNKVYNAETFDHPDLIGLNLISLSAVTYATRILHKSGLRVFERCFYEDLQYDYMAYAYVETFVFNDNIVYKYFIGRPEQSMSRESAIRNFEQAIRIRLSLAQYYVSHAQSMPDNDMRKKWMLNYMLYCLWLGFPMLSRLPLKQAVVETTKYIVDIRTVSEGIWELLKKERSYARIADLLPRTAIIAAKFRDKIFKRH